MIQSGVKEKLGRKRERNERDKKVFKYFSGGRREKGGKKISKGVKHKTLARN